MELLIPGLILVAIMVWASTRIKRNAALAYAEETVENDRFAITKPEGFLSPVDLPNGVLFVANSRDFGRDEAESFRCVAAEITELPETDLAAAREQAAETADVLSEDTPQLVGETRVLRLTAERTEDGVKMHEYFKLIESADSTLRLRISAIAEQEEEYSGKIDQMLDSFRAI